jgi:hypothetical protein
MITLFDNLVGATFPAPLGFIPILFAYAFAFAFILSVLSLLFFWKK